MLGLSLQPLFKVSLAGSLVHKPQNEPKEAANNHENENSEQHDIYLFNSGCVNLHN